MGTFAKIAEEWQDKLKAQQAQMETAIPSSEHEAMLVALKRLADMRTKSQNLGYNLRAHFQRDSLKDLFGGFNAGELPMREHLIDIPALQAKSAEEKKALLGAVIDPLKHAIQDLKLEGMRAGDEQLQSATRTTTDPATLPMYYPAMALTAPQGFISGYQQADKDLDTQTNQKLDAEVDAARKAFEAALAEEYSAVRKNASFGTLLEDLGQLHVKKADGELNSAAGLYLALASILGSVAYNRGRDWSQQSDPRYQKLKAVREVVKQRTRAKPPTVLVSPLANQTVDNPLEGKDNIPPLTE